MNHEERSTMRRQTLARRDSMPLHERAGKSLSISSRVMAIPEITDAGTILVYMHFRSEVQTTELINRILAAGKYLAIPRTLPATLQLAAVGITDPDTQTAPGYRGIPEPLPLLAKQASCDPQIIDAVVVPGSVFDRFGGRLGYGGGFYDRFLATAAPGAARVGLAFELQMVDRVPVEPHDQLMDFVVTEENIYHCRRNRHAQNSRLSR
ncbi:MAG: 5-formyltetrahydrofolate cyclo-ligase [Desulfobulbaceae bacterium]|nr:5-formyltetrahydrofolate cyclo-ligase [Desulfobulbaceae bacterium]